MVQDSAPYAVRFERPGRLRLRAYQVHLAVDDNRLRTRFMDKEVPDLARQMVDRAAPNELDLPSLKFDSFLWDHLEGGIGGLPISLRLLIDDNMLADVFMEDIQLKQLPAQTIGNDQCHVVQVRAAGNSASFWIDRDSYVLRRFEYPPIDGLTIVADFQDARFDGPLDDQDFGLPLPPDARRVKYFVVPPQPLATKLFGQTVDQFEFTALNGDTLSPHDLGGRTTALVWFNNHPSCQAALTELQQVYESYRGNDQVRFYAVWAEGASLTRDQLQALLDEWKVDIPVVRDSEAFGRDAFGIPAAPTMVVLDSQNRVQVFEIGVRPDLAVFLPRVLNQVSQGVDVAAELMRQHEKESQEYQRDLVIASAETQETVFEIPRSDVQPRSEPKLLKLTKQWSLTQINAPGNITVLNDGNKTSFAVMDGLRSVVAVGVDGEVLQRVELDLPTDGKVNFLQPVSDANGRRFVVGGTSMASEVFVFDEYWQTLMQYPTGNQQHEGIQDAQLFDLDADGTLELYVGFWGLVGVHAVDLHGKRLWSNRAAHSVLSLAATPPDAVGRQRLLVASAQGRILPIARNGRDEAEIAIGSRSIYHLRAARALSDGKPVYCGLAFASEDAHLALGINENFRETWSYPLPNGMHQTPVRPMTSARFLDGQTYWLFPGADGSVLIVRADGAFHDAFHHGSAIRGLAAVQSGSQSLLVIAKEQGITGYAAELGR